MPFKTSKMPAKTTCDKFRRNISSTEMTVSKKMPRKVLISKNWHQNCSHETKTKSAGIINSEQRTKPSKTSVSLPTVPKQSRLIDFCKTCGDNDDIEPSTMVADTNPCSKSNFLPSKMKKEESISSSKQLDVKSKTVEEYYKNERYENSKSTKGYAQTQKKSTKTIKFNTKKNKGAVKQSKEEVENLEVVQEHYVNEKFADIYDSTHEIDNVIRSGHTLDTITEVNEKLASSNSKTTLSDGKTSLESKYSTNVSILDNSDDDLSLKRLKEFRNKNYFECHSAKNRVQSKGSAISLKEHTCSYRLYLNDRLFPVALDDDYNGNIRCVDCHLPLELASKEKQVNGTIQAKVKLGSVIQDMVLLLPIKEPLIIKQKKKEKNDNETVYFGVVQLDQNGNSIFKRSLPSDSLALRYQKGFRQLDDVENYRYDKVEESDVIVI